MSTESRELHECSILGGNMCGTEAFSAGCVIARRCVSGDRVRARRRRSSLSIRKTCHVQPGEISMSSPGSPWLN